MSHQPASGRKDCEPRDLSLVEAEASEVHGTGWVPKIKIDEGCGGKRLGNSNHVGKERSNLPFGGCHVGNSLGPYTFIVIGKNNNDSSQLVTRSLTLMGEEDPGMK